MPAAAQVQPPPRRRPRRRFRRGMRSPRSKACWKTPCATAPDARSASEGVDRGQHGHAGGHGARARLPPRRLRRRLRRGVSVDAPQHGVEPAAARAGQHRRCKIQAAASGSVSIPAPRRFISRDHQRSGRRDRRPRAPIGVGADEWLTVAARESVDRRFVPADPSDTRDDDYSSHQGQRSYALRDRRLPREDARKRVEIKRY